MVFQIQPSVHVHAPIGEAIALQEHPAGIVQAASPASVRASARHMRYWLAAAPAIAPQGVYVGELQEKWQFPSDHLPIGMSISGLKIISWNVLNPLYMGWVIEKNSQGLSRSQIAQEHYLLPNRNITAREDRVIGDVLKMFENGQSAVALQECGWHFLKELEKRLPAGFRIAFEKEGFSKDQNVVIYDENQLTLVELKSPATVFSQEKRPIMDLLFDRRGGQGPLRIVNAHLPGDPAGPARYEFASYVSRAAAQGISTIALGDMNFNELEMRDAFEGSPFRIYTPYCTNISPHSHISKAIDHFMIDSSETIVIQGPEEVYSALQAMVDLLEKSM